MRNRHCIALFLLLCVPVYGQAQTKPDLPPRPNVLLVIADDLSAEALSSYGNPQAVTPNLDKLAQRGTVMDRAYCQFPVCGPARAALLSGLYPQQSKVTGNSDRDILSQSLGQHPTMPQYFKQNGYTTARCGKLYHMRVPGHITAGVHGPDHPASWTERYSFQAPEQWTAGKTAHFSGEKLRPDPQRNKHYGLGYGSAFYVVEDPTDGSAQHDVKATDKAIELLGKYKQTGDPFFLAVGYVRPHVPLVAPEQYFEPFEASEMKLPEQVADDLADIPRIGWSRIGARSGTDTDAKRKGALRGYYASVSFMDAQFGRLLDELDKQGLSKNTIVIFLSDHGYHLGEHDLWQKMSLHEESARIPLIAAGPGIEPGQRWPGLVESVDMYPTLCLMAGLPIPEACAGTLLYGMKDDPKHTAYTFLGRGHLLRTKDWAYMRYRNGSEELYDMKNDPKQFRNLAGDNAAAESLSNMRELLDQKLETIGRHEVE